MEPVLRRLFTVGLCVGIVVAVICLAIFDPVEWPAPRCVFHSLTGLECPGCGTQRAIHALFRGDFRAAFDFNPALFVALPLVGLYGWSPRPLRGILYSPLSYVAIAAAILLWWIIRNI